MLKYYCIVIGQSASDQALCHGAKDGGLHLKRHDDVPWGYVQMIRLSDRHRGWASALHLLAENITETPGGDGPVSPTDDADDEREPFHLDDTELANRLARDRGLPYTSSPSHAERPFPLAVQP